MIQIRTDKPNLNIIKNIFFDNGGTLSLNSPHEDNGRPYIHEIMKILEVNEDTDKFKEKMRNNLMDYKKWSIETLNEASEEEISSKWLFRDYDKKKTKTNANKLISLCMSSKGNRVIDPKTYNVFKTLTEKGINLGVISNTLSKTQVPSEYKETDIKKFLKTITLSVNVGFIKPATEIFNIALKDMNAKAEESVYIGNKPTNDVEAPRKANFAYCIILNNINTEIKDPSTLPKEQQADAYITEIKDLLELF